MAVQMIEHVHQGRDRGIGELTANNIVLQVKDKKIIGARLGLPDLKYNEEIDTLKQQATDLLYFCFSTGTGSLQSGDENSMQATIHNILSTYTNKEVKTKMHELMNQGIPSLSMHNSAGLGFDRELKMPKTTAYNLIKSTILNLTAN